MVSWLIEHQDLPGQDDSDTDSLSSIDGFSESESMSDDMDDFDTYDVSARVMSSPMSSH